MSALCQNETCVAVESGRRPTSASGHERQGHYATSASQQKSSLLDHFVDGGKKRVRAPYTDCLGEYRLHVRGQRSSRPTPYKPLSAYLLF
jgi:hypothetical protein